MRSTRRHRNEALRCNQISRSVGNCYRVAMKTTAKTTPITTNANNSKSVGLAIFAFPNLKSNTINGTSNAFKRRAERPGWQ